MVIDHPQKQSAFWKYALDQDPNSIVYSECDNYLRSVLFTYRAKSNRLKILEPISKISVYSECEDYLRNISSRKQPTNRFLDTNSKKYLENNTDAYPNDANLAIDNLSTFVKHSTVFEEDKKKAHNLLTPERLTARSVQNNISRLHIAEFVTVDGNGSSFGVKIPTQIQSISSINTNATQYPSKEKLHNIVGTPEPGATIIFIVFFLIFVIAYKKKFAKSVN